MRITNSHKGGFTLLEIAFVVLILGFFVAIAIPNFVRSRTASSANSCINNLRLIDSAKQQWALVKGMTTEAVPVGSDLQPYLGRGTAGELPYCPQSTNYSFEADYSPNKVRERPSCKVFPSQHVLPP